MPHVFDAWEIDVRHKTIDGSRPLWPAYEKLWQIRHDFVHRGEPVDRAAAGIAIACADALIEEVVAHVAKLFGIGWPVARWAENWDTPSDPLARARPLTLD